MPEIEAYVVSRFSDVKRVLADDATFDLARRNGRQHLAFGRGTHACPGSLLARNESRVATQTLVARPPDLRLAADLDELPDMRSYIQRGITRLPVTFTPSAASTGR